MSKFIEEFYYGNIDPQARSTKQNKTVQKQMEVLMLNDSHLRMLIEQITVTEKGGKLTVNFMQGGSHRIHFVYYNENGEMIDRDYERGVEGEQKTRF